MRQREPRDRESSRKHRERTKTFHQPLLGLRLWNKNILQEKRGMETTENQHHQRHDYGETRIQTRQPELLLGGGRLQREVHRAMHLRLSLQLMRKMERHRPRQRQSNDRMLRQLAIGKLYRARRVDGAQPKRQIYQHGREET